MEDWNSRYGAAIGRGLDRFCYESRLCGEVEFDGLSKPVHEMKASAEDARLVRCWLVAQQEAARQGVDVHTLLLGLGCDSDGELVESLAAPQVGTKK
ncbi:hypothetical protein D3C86_1845800 [compost metagenome]